MTLWLCGRLARDSGLIAEIFGIFSTEARAIAHCSESDHFVGPLTLDLTIGEDPRPWVGCYLPLNRAADALAVGAGRC